MNESEILIEEKITNEMSKMLSSFQLENQDALQTYCFRNCMNKT